MLGARISELVKNFHLLSTNGQVNDAETMLQNFLQRLDQQGAPLAREGPPAEPPGAGREVAAAAPAGYSCQICVEQENVCTLIF